MRIIRLENSIKTGRRKGKKLWLIAGLVLAGGILHGQKGLGADTFRLRDEMMEEVQEKAYQTCIPVFSFLDMISLNASAMGNGAFFP